MACSALNELTSLQQRQVVAIVGALVADAAAQPIHWVYNESKLKSLTEGKEEIEFRIPSANPFYRIPTGSNSCYGDQAYVMLKTLVECKGLDLEKMAAANYEFFGPESDYENAENGNYKVGKEDKINIKKTLPIEGPWRHGCIKGFLSNVQDGITPPGSEMDDQIDCAIRVIPLIAWLAGQPGAFQQVEDALRILQNNDIPIASGLATARILEQYILHGDPGNALQKVIDQLSDPDNDHPHELDRAIVGQIREVLRVKGTSHQVAVPKFFKNN